MRFEAPSALSAPQPPSATTKWAKAPETFLMQDEIQALEAQRLSLQLLVSELLVANQKLRLEIAKLTQPAQAIATATHPQPRPDR